MEVFYNVDEIKSYLSSLVLKDQKIGFVPTMGALHDGHLQLVKEAHKLDDINVVSIFVNPTQFNNPSDLKNYPRDLEGDLKKLKSASANIIFVPKEKDIYALPLPDQYNFGGLDKCMEGTFRPGHFNGVAMVVHRLFDIIRPNHAYFGEKDFQQLAIIQYLNQSWPYQTKIIPVPIVREIDGLAMSSRNMRLSDEERKVAPMIYKTLVELIDKIRQYSVQQLKAEFVSIIDKVPFLKTEYIEIVDQTTLQLLKDWNDASDKIICVAVFCGEVRLIDNIKINS